MEKIAICESDGKILAVGAAGNLFVDDKPVTVNEAIEIEVEASLTGETHVGLPPSDTLVALQAQLDAETATITAEIKECEGTVEMGKRRLAEDTAKCAAAREETKRLEERLREIKPLTYEPRELPQAEEASYRITDLKKSIQDREAEVAGEIDAIRQRTKLTPEEMAAIRSDVRLHKRLGSGEAAQQQL